MPAAPAGAGRVHRAEGRPEFNILGLTPSGAEFNILGLTPSGVPFKQADSDVDVQWSVPAAYSGGLSGWDGVFPYSIDALITFFLGVGADAGIIK